MIYFKTTGMLSNKPYYFASSKFEEKLLNIFPIMENFNSVEFFDKNPFDKVDVVYVLGNNTDEGPRLALPCFSVEEVKRATQNVITMKDFEKPDVANFLKTGQKIRILDEEYVLGIDPSSKKIIDAEEN